MEQKALRSQTNSEDSGRPIDREQILETMEQIEVRSKQIAPGETGRPKSDSGHRKVWLGAILCSFFLHKWSNPLDSAVAETPRSAPALDRFARMGRNRFGAAHKTVTRRSHHPLEQVGFNDPTPQAVPSSGSRPLNFAWKLPGLLLIFLLLAWLLLL